MSTIPPSPLQTLRCLVQLLSSHFFTAMGKTLVGSCWR